MNDVRLISSVPRVEARQVAGLTVVADLEVVAGTPAATRHGMALLAAGVPLSLLFDLADPAGPPSADMLSSEQHLHGRHSLVGDLMAFRTDARRRLHG